MKRLRYLLWIFLTVLISVSAGCQSAADSNQTEASNLPVNEISQAAGTPTSPTLTEPADQSKPSNTPFASPTQAPANPAEASATPTATQAMLCTTLANLKVRSGPGTAYEPPITAVTGGTSLIPFGFNPVGIPDGGWVLVSSPDGTFTGWVSTNPRFLTCNFDLTTLPSVDVAPPQPTATPTPTATLNPQGNAPRVSNNGGFGGCPENLVCETSFSAAWLYVEDIRSASSGISGEGVEYVKFEIWDLNQTTRYYERTERTPLYCTFGGDGPCNSWIYENGAFRWYAGGDPVKPGEYVMNMTIEGTTPDDLGNSQGFMQQSFTIAEP